MSFATVRFVMFDLDHTLLIDHGLEKCVLVDLSKKYFGISPDLCAFERALDRFRAGLIPLSRMLEEALGGAVEAKISVKALISEYQKKCLDLVGELTALGNVPKILRDLEKGGLGFGALSNGWSELQIAKADAVGFTGPVITSEMLGAWKPDSSAFHGAVRRLNFELSNTLYAGDSPETDVNGSKRAGMLAAWLNSDKKAYPDFLRRPDIIITSIEELPGRIVEWNESGGEIH